MPFLPQAFKPRELIPIAAAIAALAFANPDFRTNVRRYSLEGFAAVASRIAYLDSGAWHAIEDINDLRSRYGDMGLGAEARARRFEISRQDRLSELKFQQSRFDEQWFLSRWPEGHRKDLKTDLDRAANLEVEMNNMREAMIALGKLQAGSRTPQQQSHTSHCTQTD